MGFYLWDIISRALYLSEKYNFSSSSFFTDSSRRFFHFHGIFGFETSVFSKVWAFSVTRYYISLLHMFCFLLLYSLKGAQNFYLSWPSKPVFDCGPTSCLRQSFQNFCYAYLVMFDEFFTPSTGSINIVRPTTQKKVISKLEKLRKLVEMVSLFKVYFFCCIKNWVILHYFQFRSFWHDPFFQNIEIRWFCEVWDTIRVAANKFTAERS